MLNLVIFKHQSKNYENMKIAQGVLGNYALVSQTFSIISLCMFCTRHWHREKIFDPFFLPKNKHWIWHFVTFCIFLYWRVFTEPISEAHNIDIFLAKNIKSV